MSLTNRSGAMLNPAGHIFRPGVGYVEVPKLPMFGPSRLTGNGANPPKLARDGTRHILLTPGGVAETFTWHAATKTWLSASLSGHRLGFTADYLSHHGWTYKKQAPTRVEVNA
jgi:hypothetical protein